jgi:hypothetical protein
MVLTVHYQLATTGHEAHARKLVQPLRQAALDLPFQPVGGIGAQSAILAGFLGALKDAMGQAPSTGPLEAPITGYPNFEHLAAEGQRLLPEQLQRMLKTSVERQ